MSEYQYYEFQAIDHPLTESQLRELRKYSTRATITPTSFTNEYNWGNFKGDTHQWMEAYFDAFVYLANWGSHWLDFRVPGRLLDPKIVSMYCTDEGLSCRVKGDFVIVSFASEDEPDEWVEDEGWLASLTPLRADLINGDLRCLYLGWLGAAQEGQLEDNEKEPPPPPGLGALSSPLQALADFLRIDPDWITAAAEASAEVQAAALTDGEVAGWIDKMPPKDKDAVIAALIDGSDSYWAAEFRQRAVREIRGARKRGSQDSASRRRSVGEIEARARVIEEDRRRREAKAHARAKTKREREQAEARKKRLVAIAEKEDLLWSQIHELIATRQPNQYDSAVSLLQDLRDLAAMTEQHASFAARMDALREEHARKPSLLGRFRKGKL